MPSMFHDGSRSLQVDLDAPALTEGYYEVWSRATDARGIMQPHTAGNWNPQGYGANPMHRIAILVG